jgi:Bacterial Ig-like domain (group 3)/FG-GAP-like repeat
MGPIRQVVAVFTIISSAAGPAIASCPGPTLSELPSTPAGEAARFALGDVNNDGDSDLVTTAFLDKEVKVRLGNGDGTFGSPLVYPAPSPQEIVLGDLDNDSFLDIIVSDGPYHTAECWSARSCAGYSVLLNDGDGTFGPATTMPVPSASFVVSLALADFTDDGNLDLVVAGPPVIDNEPNLHVLLGDGTGAFPARRSWAADGKVRDVVAASLGGGTAQPDLIAMVGPGTSSTFTRLIVYPSQNGTFPASSATRNIAETNSESHLAAADFDRDGKPDLAFTFHHSGGIWDGTWGVGVVITNGNTVLSAPRHFVRSSPSTDLAVEDLDEDGDADIMTARNNPWWNAYMMNGPDFPLTEEEGLREGSVGDISTHARQVIADDFDHDGRPDLFFLDGNNDTIIAVQNICASRHSKATLSSSPNSTRLGHEATFTIQVEPKPNAPMPTGTVTLHEGTTALGQATLNGSGIATITLTSLSSGAHTLHATYGGDGNFAAQTSASHEHTVETPPPFGPPLGVTATGNSATNQITVAWTATGDTTSHDVLRRANGSWQVIANVTGEVYVDSDVASTSAYVYAVQSHSTGGVLSGVSNSDIGTTAALALPGDNRIRASDVLTPRSLVNSLRGAAGLSPFTFTNASLTGVAVQALHVTQLRTAANDARTALGLAPLTFANPALTPDVTPIRKVDVQELRDSFL